MTSESLRHNLNALFRDAAAAHRAATSSPREQDPDWAIWYANHLQQPLQQEGSMDFVKSRLIYCLMNADNEYSAREPDASWEAFVADRFVECYAASEAPAEDRLALYYLPTCPYCIRVMRVIDQLGLDIELRNILASKRHRDDLLAARGRTTVPVLRISEPAGTERWMPESLDIIDYLKRNYGQQA